MTTRRRFLRLASACVTAPALPAPAPTPAQPRLQPDAAAPVCAERPTGPIGYITLCVAGRTMRLAVW